MTSMQSILAAALLAVLSTAASAAEKGVTSQDRRQAACAQDVEKLCPGLIPTSAR